MEGSEPLAPAAGAPRLGPAQVTRWRRGLVAMFVAMPALSALYGLHRAGAGGAGGGAVAGLLGASVIGFAGVQLLRWFEAPAQPPLWRFEKAYWWSTAVASMAVWVAVMVLIGFFDPVEEHGPEAIVDGVIAGFVGAALFLFLAARLHAWLMWLRGPVVVAAGDAPSGLQSLLAPMLTELEAVRLEVGRRARRRAARMTPAGVAAGITAWVGFTLATHEFDLLLPVVAVLAGGLAGHVIAVGRLVVGYQELFKRRVLARLAQQFGLSYQRPAPPDLERLRQFHVFRRFDAAYATAAISGEYRGLKTSLVQLELTRGFFHSQVFRGLLIEIELKNQLSGVTAVAAHGGALGDLVDHLAAKNIRRVALESPAFERAFEVYATDQVMARALLTPAFMERFMALGGIPGFVSPLALAQDTTLIVAMPRSEEWRGKAAKMYPDFFAPPDYDLPADDDEKLERLYRDIGTVLRAVDAVIALDEATSRGALRPGRSGKRRVDRAGGP